MKLIDYCVKLSDEETCSSVAESIIEEQTASEGLAMIMVLIKMASTGGFIRGLAEPEKFDASRDFILKIDTDVLVVETFIYMGLCVSRSSPVEGIASSNVHLLDYSLNDDVARITHDVIEQFTQFNPLALIRNRRRLFVETRRAKKEISGTFIRVLYASSHRSALSDPLDMIRFNDAELETLDELKVWLDTCTSNMLRVYRRALDKYADLL